MKGGMLTAYEELIRFVDERRSGVEQIDLDVIVKEARETFDDAFFARLARERLREILYWVTQQRSKPSAVVRALGRLSLETPKDPAAAAKLKAKLTSVFDKWHEYVADRQKVQLLELDRAGIDAAIGYRKRAGDTEYKYARLLSVLGTRLKQGSKKRVRAVWTETEIAIKYQEIFGEPLPSSAGDVSTAALG